MKKQIGIKKALDKIPLQELEDWSTYALLARLKRLRWCYEKPEDANDYTKEELDSVKEKLLFKSDPRWQQAYHDVKGLLDTREHTRRIKRA